MSDGAIAAHRQARARSICNRAQTAFCAGCTVNTGPRHSCEDRIRKARAWIPDACIGSDVMTGFPGETEKEFEESREFIESLPFTYLHVFTYSERPGTPAAERQDQVPMEVRKERNRILRELAAQKNLDFRRSMIGRMLSVVTLAEGALSDNFLKVELSVPRAANQMVDVNIASLSPNGLRGAGHSVSIVKIKTGDRILISRFLERYQQSLQQFTELISTVQPSHVRQPCAEFPRTIHIFRKESGNGYPVTTFSYISRRFSSDLPIVTSSANSRSLPTGMPIAIRVTFTPSGFVSRER